jgi:hypothetical protein
MEWSNGFTARYLMSVVDTDTWRDIRSARLTSGKIDKSTDNLQESADITVTELPTEDGECWVRIYLDARQNGDASRVPIFTGLTSAPQRGIEDLRESYNLECYSVLKPASDILLPRGWYAPMSMNAAQLAAKLLSVGPAPVTYADDAPDLGSPIVAEDDETNLTMAVKILDAINWRIKLSGRGEINILPASDEPIGSFGIEVGDIFELSVTDKYDWYSVPNVFRAVSSDEVAVARDDDPASQFSTVSRGREIWQQDKSVSLADGESLSDYAERRLTELQSPSRTISYDRRYCPGITANDCVRISYPAQRIDGVFRVTKQSITLGQGCTVSEEASIVSDLRRKVSDLTTRQPEPNTNAKKQTR